MSVRVAVSFAFWFITTWSVCAHAQPGEISKPQDLMGVFRNIKIVMDRETLLQADFYTDENLLALFGGRRVRWDHRTQAAIVGEIYNLDSIVPRQTIGGRSYAGLQAFFTWSVSKEQKRKATASLAALAAIPGISPSIASQPATPTDDTAPRQRSN